MELERLNNSMVGNTSVMLDSTVEMLETQYSTCSATSFNSNSSDESLGYCSISSTSSASSSDSVLLDAPPGPISALDFSCATNSEERIFCFDEKNNCIVSIDVREKSRSLFAVPVELQFERYYWSHVLLVRSDIVLGLLKKHKTRTFYLASFRLLADKNAAVELARSRTKVRSEGYQVSCQKVNDEVYFGFSNRTATSKIKTGKWTSDVDLVKAQIIKAQKRSKSSDSGVEADLSVKGDENLPSPTDENFDVDEEEKKRAETVLLQVKCAQDGGIQWQIFSLGKDRFEVSLSLPKLDVDHPLMSKLSTISTKYMTRLPSPTLRDPFYHNGEAYFVDKGNPKSVFTLKTFRDPDRGVVAALQARLRSVAFSSDLSEKPREMEADTSEGTPPSNDTVWSNFCVCSDAAYVCLQDAQSLMCSLWKLQLAEESRELKKASTTPQFHLPDEPVEVHSTMNGHDQRRVSPRSSTLKPKSRIVKRIRSDGDFEDDEVDCPLRPVRHLMSAPNGCHTFSGSSDRVTVCTDDHLKWTQVCADVKLAGVRLLENVALRVDPAMNRGCLRVLRAEPETAGQCFAVFRIQQDEASESIVVSSSQ